jgi:hypothetical protein|tara:strand:+ start:98 stop:274 length:177 start_codon:yes stop_codon:yes gene_type:complete
MTKQSEDTLFEVYTKVDAEGIRKEFDRQLKKMSVQDKHKWKDMGERWEYAYNKVKKPK